MKRCKSVKKFAAGIVVGTASLFTSVLVNMPRVSAASSTNDPGPVSYTAETQADGTPIYVTVIPRGHTISNQVRQTQPWWNWGNTLSDTYLFAVGSPSDVEMILQFTEGGTGVPTAHLYADIAGNNSIPYQWNKDKHTGVYSLAITSLQGIEAIDVTPAQGDTWLIQGHPNYNLQIHNDTHQQSSPPRAEVVHSDDGSTPAWETSKIAQDPHPDWSYDRYTAFLRMSNAPKFQVEKPFMPTFPYLGIHSGQANWFASNPNPFYFDTKSMQFSEFPFPGFQEGGIYELNSVAAPPKLDFESPFAFYNFDPSVRTAQLVIRAENWQPYDAYFYYPTPKQIQTYRYSWAMSNDGLWDYGITVGGFRTFPGQIHIGTDNVDGIAPAQLPQWTIQHPWETITLDQAMNGYPGSEGIYFYSVQSPGIWQYLLGYLDQPPQFLDNPKLPNKVELDNESTISVPLGFRDEYSVSYFHDPVLYASPIDHLMHLKWSTGGTYHFSKKAIIKTQNLDGGPYIDSWVEESLPDYKTISEIDFLDGYVLYGGQKGVLIRKLGVSSEIMNIAPPTDENSWHEYVTKVKPFQRGNNPSDMYGWISELPGPSLEGVKGSITSVQASKNGFSFLLSLTQPPKTTQILGLPMKPGDYWVTYNSNTGKWNYQGAHILPITGSVAHSSTAQVGQLSQYALSLSNPGNVPWNGSVTLNLGNSVLYEGTVSLQGHQTWKQVVGWTPESARTANLVLRINNNILFSVNQLTEGNGSLRHDFLFHPGVWEYLVDGILVLLLIFLAGGVLRVVRVVSKEGSTSAISGQDHKKI